MKNQYFGDKRDYFKYCVLTLLMQRHAMFRQLTCIWMLTPPAGNTDGNKPFRILPGCEDLAEFLRRSRAEQRQDIRELRVQFHAMGLNYFAYGDSPQEYFTNTNRVAYFDSIPMAALTESLVFLDPDNGMEPTGRATPAHLRYGNLESTFSRMGGSSAIVVYQHLPRIPAKRFWPTVAGRIESRLRAPVITVAESDVALFVVTADEALSAHLTDTLRFHQQRAADSGLEVTVNNYAQL
jgi:hypothetical protein